MDRKKGKLTQPISDQFTITWRRENIQQSDMDLDGFEDILFNSGRADIHLLKNEGDGQFEAFETIFSDTVSDPDDVLMMKITDLNNSAPAELVVLHRSISNFVEYFDVVVYSFMDGSFQIQDTVYSDSKSEFSRWGFDIETADIEGDGDVDIILTRSFGAITDFEMRILLNNEMNFSVATDIPDFVHRSTFIFADFFGDGTADLLMDDFDAKKLFLFEGLGAGIFNSPVAISGEEINRTRHISTADLDLDGDLDILRTDAGGGFYLIENEGEGIFSQSQYLFYGGIIDAHDLNQDQLPDLVYYVNEYTQNDELNVIRYRLNEGDLQFSDSADIGFMASDAWVYRIMDVNHDQALDLVALVPEYSDRMAWFENQIEQVTTSTPNESILKKRLKVFPNPASNMVYLDLPKRSGVDNVSVSIFDSQGKLADRQILPYDNKVLLDLSSIDNGFYFLKCEDQYLMIGIAFLLVNH